MCSSRVSSVGRPNSEGFELLTQGRVARAKCWRTRRVVVVVGCSSRVCEKSGVKYVRERGGEKERKKERVRKRDSRTVRDRLQVVSK